MSDCQDLWQWLERLTHCSCTLHVSCTACLLLICCNAAVPLPLYLIGHMYTLSASLLLLCGGNACIHRKFECCHHLGRSWWPATVLQRCVHGAWVALFVVEELPLLLLYMCAAKGLAAGIAMGFACCSGHAAVAHAGAVVVVVFVSNFE